MLQDCAVCGRRFEVRRGMDPWQYRKSLCNRCFTFDAAASPPRQRHQEQPKQDEGLEGGTRRCATRGCGNLTTFLADSAPERVRLHICIDCYEWKRKR
jgi:hypothetical protein